MGEAVVSSPAAAVTTTTLQPKPLAQGVGFVAGAKAELDSGAVTFAYPPGITTSVCRGAAAIGMDASKVAEPEVRVFRSLFARHFPAPASPETADAHVARLGEVCESIDALIQRVRRRVLGDSASPPHPHPPTICVLVQVTDISADLRVSVGQVLSDVAAASGNTGVTTIGFGGGGGGGGGVTVAVGASAATTSTGELTMRRKAAPAATATSPAPASAGAGDEVAVGVKRGRDQLEASAPAGAAAGSPGSVDNVDPLAGGGVHKIARTHGAGPQAAGELCADAASASHAVLGSGSTATEGL